MTVCQGCGRGCDSDLCCPTCASLKRSSFFCSQDCFVSNWKEHCKLHSIIKQQIRMAELDDRERKVRGLSAASSALSAISDLFRPPTPVPEHVSIEKDQQSSAPTMATFKDHQIRPIDRLIGPNGLVGGFRIILLLTGIIFLVFVKINSMISEIPAVVEKRTVVKVGEALNSGEFVANNAALVSPMKSEKSEDQKESVALRGEIERLRKQVEQYKGLYESAVGTTVVPAPPNETVEAHIDQTVSKLVEVGVVKEEDIQPPRALREVGAVGVEDVFKYH